MIRIMTVMDNIVGTQELLHAEPALSFYITLKDKVGTMSLMFDFGAGRSTLENAQLLGVPLKKINYAIASHAHYDHGNGYPFLFEAGLCCPLVTGRWYFREKYELRGESAAYIGVNFNKLWLEENRIEHRECNTLMKLARGLWVIGSIEQNPRRDFETIPQRFVLRDRGTWRRDTFSDEICLAIDTPKGIVLVVGCSHPGIVNIIEAVRTRLGRPLRAIVGGTHLRSADDNRLEKTIDVIRDLRDKDGLSLVAFNHCSGTRVQEFMEAASLPTVTLRVGDCLFFE